MEREVLIGPGLHGTLAVPSAPRGVVVFAHGSGSSRHSPRNRFVAERLGAAGFATLLADLLTVEEEAVDRFTSHHRFDIPLLGRRTINAVHWISGQHVLAGLPIGTFGASTGAAAALIAAAEEPDRVLAVVSRGGRPDLAGDDLARVRAPTLLLVGGWDDVVIDLNRRALARLAGEKELVIVPEATHLFEEPGKLEQVADLAAGWFERWLVRAPEPALG
jgi:dienelactone hydrolase